ncbi:DUF58 domain-containing protein [Azospirillum lipoferum]|uniref:DUF58 domain-containing protein n=1 Tax=Azospirillum lipoferum (strain 4B) TaxID=862719 RepID=G7Z9U0_AZOL4|nr:hypothetical protein [Azospirillum lipoferum]CBS89142.1 conserved protein of unknown function [Azospirillum lipoferum 4B]
MMPATPIPYRLRWRPGGARAGAHPGSGEGGEGVFLRHRPLWQNPDPRRIDLRETVRDPLGNVQVRSFARRSAVAVVAVVDLTGSMAFDGGFDGVFSRRAARMEMVAALCATLAVSAGKMGDRFGLIGCDAGLREDVFIPATHRRGVETDACARLLAAVPQGASAQGLLEAADRLPARRSLVVLISDFLLPLDLVGAVFDRLWRHDVLPVLLRDSGEETDLPAWGLVALRDLETGQRRLAVMRPGLRAAWRQAAQAHRTALDRLFRRHGRAPFILTDPFDPDALAEHLAAG